MALLTRRQLIRLALPAGEISINLRQTWASDRPPLGPLETEDVRFLIVHHSASRNGHTGADAPAILRSFYDFHTGDRGWNDIAYNFLIDSEGGIWEGRAGSLEGPVAGDATGGNQGFTQLVCVIGDFSTAQPTQASLSSLVVLLAWLADRYQIPTTPGSEVTFTSRGSNRHPSGAEVTTPSIIGHRAMSQTSCPGDNLNSYVVGDLMGDVETARALSASSTTTTTLPTTTTTVPTTSTTTPLATSTSVPATSTLPAAVEAPVDESPFGLWITTGAIAAVGAGLVLWRHRRMGS